MARVLVIIGAILLAMGVGLGGLNVVQRYQDAVLRQEVDKYTAGVLPPAQLAGKFVAQSILPTIDGYAQGQVSSATVAKSAAAWRAYFIRTRAEFHGVAHPDKLAAVAAGFDKSLGEYAAAVTYFELVQTPQVATAIAQGRAAAARGDADYAAASNLLGCLRQSLGMRSVAQFKVTGACPAES